MIIQYLKPDEKNRTKILWEEVFNTDTKQFVEYYYKNKVRDNEILVMEKNNTIISMLQLNPYTLSLNDRILDVFYLVGVATQKEERKKGYMRLLLEKTLRDLSEKGHALIYLMPADEKIYTPFDFNFIYNQVRIDGVDIDYSSESNFFMKKATLEDANSLSNFANKIISIKYGVYMCRDERYYLNLIEEAVASNGNVYMCFKDNELVGIFTLEMEDENTVYIIEPICQMEIYKTFLSSIILMNKSKNYNIKILGADPLDFRNVELKPIIMGRILNLEVFLDGICSKDPLELCISITDKIIRENDGTFVWSINRNCSTISRLGKNVLQAAEIINTVDLAISIRDLTAWLMGYISVDELYISKKIACSKDILDILKNIITYNKVFINEIV